MVEDFCGFLQPSEWETHASRRLICVCKYLMEKVKETEPGSFQWCPVTGWEAMGTNWNTCNST